MALPYELEDILEEFDSLTLERAQKIRRQGKILKLEVGEGWIRGKVRGSEGETYKQNIEFSHRRGSLYIQGECSCPVDFNCKHVAALLIEALEKEDQNPKQPQPTLPTAKTIASKVGSIEKLLQSGKVVRSSQLEAKPSVQNTPATALSRDLEAWLQNAAIPKTPASQETATHKLLFVLDLARDSKEVYLSVRLKGVRLNPDGGLGTPNDFNYLANNLANLPKYALPDRPLLVRLVRFQSGLYSSGSEVKIPGEWFGDEVLEALLQTGRCYWRKVDGKALELGATRAGKAQWISDAAGRQSPGFASDLAFQVVLPFRQVWYVDTASSQIGLLQTDLEAPLAQLFLRCPPIPPEQAAVFLQRIPEALKARLPKPKVLEVEEQFLAPIPHLRLFAQQIKISWSEVPLVSLAELSFGYGNRRFKPSEPMSVLERSGEQVLRVHRDPKTEAALEKTLHVMGLRSLDKYLYQVPKDLKGCLTFFINHPHTESEWLNFVSERLPQLRKQGWQIEIDPGFPYSVLEGGDWFASLEQGNDWFGLELGIMVEGQQVNLIPVLLEFIRHTNLSSMALQQMHPEASLYPMLPDGRRLKIEAGRVKNILTVLIELYGGQSLSEGKLRLPILDAVRLAELESSLKLRWHGGEKLLELGRKLRNFEGIPAIEAPPNLQATLRPYQLQGVAWLQFLREYDLSGVLADDMGLGKTLQTLAHLLLEKQAGRAKQPSLIVAPTSVVQNWQAEAARFTPDLSVLVLHGKERKRDFKKITQHDLVLTTYPLLLRDLEDLRPFTFHLLVLDEAQYIKNARSGAAQAAAGLKANHRLALTGTPLENHLGELWSLFNFLMPGFLGQADEFKKNYRNPIERQGDSLRIQALANRVRPFMLRRSKELVAKELPEKSEFVVKVELEQAQRDLYETLRVAMHSRVQEEISQRGLARSQIMVLDALLKLRQACCDPRLLSLEVAKKVKESAKLDWLKENLPQMLEEGRRVLLFSQFATMLGLLEPLMQEQKIPYVKLTGESQNRPELIRTFQSGGAHVFLISLKAGGVGLNLTAADTVIHYDPWWNPAAENQATDRAHRIGQTKPVFVYKLIAAGSVEEKIIKLQERKAALAAGILEGSLGSTVALTQDDLGYLFAPLE